MTRMLDGAKVLVESLRRQGVEYMFGVVGVPVFEVSMAAQQVGIKYIGMRNEQSAAYAAGVIGYLTKRPGVCLTVSGPGVLHAIGGLANAQSNAWPMILIGGSCERQLEGIGAFQEYPQVASCRLHTKYAARPSSVAQIPSVVEKATKEALFGRPGATYIDMPADIITGEIEESQLHRSSVIGDSPTSLACPQEVRKAIDLLRGAKRPLIIVGKGCAYARAEKMVREFVEKSGVPYLPTPMGKGVIPDDHVQCISPARTKALQEADVILLLGARTNWMLHFAQPPRFNAGVKIIQCDVKAEEFHNSVPNEVSLLGDLNAVCSQLLSACDFKHDAQSQWLTSLRAKMQINAKVVQGLMDSTAIPMNYHAVYKIINKYLPKDTVIVNEGANTMDIGRTMLPNHLPRHRLDAGTFGTMGLGLGFAVAAALHNQTAYPGKRVACIQGDSAFGFSALDYETAVRYRLPLICIIINNNGIYNGFDENTWQQFLSQGQHEGLVLPPNSLTPSARYEEITKMFGGQGFHVTTHAELESAMKAAVDTKDRPTVINVIIDGMAQRKPQDFEWHTKAKM
ncbi:2-hydroxyacyl-CoA lyase 1 [Galendromus occidentalis]|uniref:2-hydroxyacyl-CoA lyase 1 n=1 Tax=Galendromus occidentalis TaxID=34638 RepID=A0AAJ6QLU8_9ACAR|nr:2-hydroxyacyl-CoA lyase 1 [Galendromus occidentalis]